MTVINYLLLTIILASAQCKSQKMEDSNLSGLEAEPLSMAANSVASVSEDLSDVSDFTPYLRAIENGQPYDTIRIPSERFLVRSTIDINSDHLTIACEGCTLLVDSKTNLFSGNDVEGLTISGIRVKSLQTSTGNLLRIKGGTNLKLLDSHAENMGLLFLEKGSQENVHQNLVVEGSSAINAGADGIKLQAVRGFIISNSKFINCKKDGIKTNLAPCDQGIIKNCYFNSNGDDGFDLFGGGSNILIDSSTFVDSKIQLKNIGGQYYRGEIENCTIKNSTLQNTAIICLSKYIPDTEYKGLSGIVIDNNQWINDAGSCFQTNGAVNFKFTNNHLLVKNAQKAIDVRPPLGEAIIANNVIESGITKLEKDPKKGVYLLATKKQYDPHFGVRDDNSNLRIEGNTFINGRRDFVLDGLANYHISDNTSIGQSDRSVYLGVDKLKNESKAPSFKRTSSNNKIVKNRPEKQ